MSALTDRIAAEHTWQAIFENDAQCKCGHRAPVGVDANLGQIHLRHVAEVTEAAVWSASLASVDLSNLTKPSRGDARRRAHVDRRTPVHPEDAWAFEQGVQAGVDAVFALLSDGEQQATRRAEAAVREASTTASDVIEGAMRMLDCGECAERLARLADQWRADEAAVLASVKPSREAVVHMLYEQVPYSWDENDIGILADAFLDLPGWADVTNPSREAVARVLNPPAWKAYDAMMELWPDEPSNPVIVEDSLAKADTILAQWPGKTEAEVREQVASEIKDAKTAVIKGTRRMPRDVLFAYDDAEDIAREGGQRS